MIPSIDMSANFTVTSLPSRTFQIDFERGRIAGYVDKVDAVKQAIVLILNTQRYCYPVVSWNYGVEFDDLYGQPKYAVMSLLRSRISDALQQDDRITSVDDFEFETGRGTITVTFTAHSIYGNIKQEVTVNV